MSGKETQPDTEVEIVLRKADQLLHGPPSSKSELERIYRTSRSRKMPLKSREQIEAPLQQGVSYLHVQGKALDSVRDVLGQLESLLEESGSTTRRRKAFKSIQLDLILLGDTKFNGHNAFTRNGGAEAGAPFYFPEGLGRIFLRQLNLGKLLAGILEAEDPDDLIAESVRHTTLNVHALLGQIRAAAEELEVNFQHYSERFASLTAGDLGEGTAGGRSWMGGLFRNRRAFEVQANVDPSLIRVVRKSEQEDRN